MGTCVGRNFGGILSIIYIKNQIIPNEILYLITSLYAGTVIFWIFTQKIYKNTLCTLSCKDKPNLCWPFVTSPYSTYIWYLYGLLVLIVIISIIKNKAGQIMAIILGSTIFISIIISTSFKIGTLWCLMVTIGPTIKLLIPESYFDD